MIKRSYTIPLRSQITCPHCWTTFPMEELLWIAESPDLVGDSRLGPTAPTRFLANGFNADGNAFDLKGLECKKLACPHCHLVIPRCLLEMEPYFISIVGAPSSGKSYFLSSMSSSLRKILPRNFAMSFSDSDPEMNARLLEYEDLQFAPKENGVYIQLNKTELQGDLYDEVLLNGQNITYPKPFIFSLCPLQRHRNHRYYNKLSFAVTMYDNAGESFLPSDGDNASLPVTRHLGTSDCIFFLFDPIQDSRFRSVCSTFSSDPQMNREFIKEFRWTPQRQEMVLTEMINRTRSYRHLQSNKLYDKPVIVVVTKYDAWRNLLRLEQVDQKMWAKTENDEYYFLSDRVDEISKRIRALFLDMIPELVGTLEQFASRITFIPVSSTGGPPERDPKTGAWGFQPGKVKSIWAEVPFLYALAHWKRGIIPLRSEVRTP